MRVDHGGSERAPRTSRGHADRSGDDRARRPRLLRRELAGTQAPGGAVAEVEAAERLYPRSGRTRAALLNGHRPGAPVPGVALDALVQEIRAAEQLSASERLRLLSCVNTLARFHTRGRPGG